jgi:hypothetical protein
MEEMIHGWNQNVKRIIPFTYKHVKCCLAINCNLITGYIYIDFMNELENNLFDTMMKTALESDKRITLQQFNDFLKTQSVAKIYENKVFFNSTINVSCNNYDRSDGITKIWYELKRIVDDLYAYCNKGKNIIQLTTERYVDNAYKQYRCFMYGFDYKDNTLQDLLEMYRVMAHTSNNTYMCQSQ